MWRPQTWGYKSKKGAYFLVIRGKVCQPILFNIVFISTIYLSLQVAMHSTPLNSNPQSTPTSRISRLMHTQKLSFPAFATLCVATSCPWNLKLVLASPGWVFIIFRLRSLASAAIYDWMPSAQRTELALASGSQWGMSLAMLFELLSLLTCNPPACRRV